MTTKLRTAVATLAATLAVALTFAPAAPAQVFRPDVMKRKADLCQDLRGMYDSFVEGAVQIDGDTDGKNRSDDNAAYQDEQASHVLADAQNAGCGWAK